MMIDSVTHMFQKFIRDKNGNVVIWQAPNIPLIGWLVFKLLSIVLSQGHLKDGFGLISSAFIFTWTYLEITDGASYFRRLLGLIVMAVLVVGFFR
jgi:hypothetical protein